MRHRVTRAARVVLLVALASQAAAVLFVVASRLRHPGDLEWMTGSVLDHIERVRAGQPIYTAPSARWIPLLYPPLYYWLGAAAGGTALAARSLSLAATAAQGALVWSAARSLAATRFWAAVSVLVFVASFPFVGFWFDLERSDNLFGAIALLGSVLLLRARGALGHAVAGVVLGLGALAKQQAAFYLAGAAVGLLLTARASRGSPERPRARDLVAFGVGACLALGLGFAAVLSGDEWAAYYLVLMPRAHGVLFRLAPVVLARDVPAGFLLIGVTLAAGAFVARALWRGAGSPREVVGGTVLVAGFAGAMASRLHIGGWFNVLIPWTAFAAVAVGVVASKVEARWSGQTRVLTVAAVAVLAQLVVWSFDPRTAVPLPASAAAEGRLRAEVSALERDGEVLLPARGHLTAVRHFHISALADAARVQGRCPADLVKALTDRAYAAVVDDARYEDFRTADWPPTILEDFDDLRPVLLASYYVARRIDYGSEPLALVSPATPGWVYRPRRAVRVADLAELRRRQLVEMRLADARAMALAAGEPAPFTEAEIEDLASAPERANRR